MMYTGVALLIVLVASAQGLVAGANTRAKRADDQSALEATVQSLAQQVSANAAEIVALRERQELSETHIAFHAEFSADPIQLGPAQVLILDNAITNVGNGYHPTSGQFQAPVSGSYMFVVNFMGDQSTFHYVNVVLDNDVVDTSISHGDGETWDHVSETMILHLTAGQQVWLTRGGEVSTVKTIRGSHWTTFSGFLIRADAA